MAYDPIRQEVVLFGGRPGIDANGVVRNDTWIWNGIEWSERTTTNMPSARRGYRVVYDSLRGEVLMAGGLANTYFLDLWRWDGLNWAVRTNEFQRFEMTTKAEAVWNFTTIEIGTDVRLSFAPNPAKAAPRWLANQNVMINGTVDLRGQGGSAGSATSPTPAGGPGGFGGGRGGIPSVQGFHGATPGEGPGGGSPGTSSGQAGTSGAYASSYGNPFIQPLIGGSGGGGSGSTPSSYGNNGGAGGGAILIASSRDIVVNGQILANGGGGYNGSGAGSGGAIRLRADRITLNSTGSLQATNDGRIRLESYERSLVGSISPSSFTGLVMSAPVAESTIQVPDKPLRIATVAGQNVVQAPGGDFFNPDVMFSQSGEVTVTVEGQGIPDGTPVRLRVTMTGDVIDKPANGEPPVLLSGGAAAFRLAVPRGRGTIQAFADFTLSSQ